MLFISFLIVSIPVLECLTCKYVHKFHEGELSYAPKCVYQMYNPLLQENSGPKTLVYCNQRFVYDVIFGKTKNAVILKEYVISESPSLWTPSIVLDSRLGLFPSSSDGKEKPTLLCALKGAKVSHCD
jgi:hypothetical protein